MTARGDFGRLLTFPAYKSYEINIPIYSATLLSSAEVSNSHLCIYMIESAVSWGVGAKSIQVI